MFDNIIEEYGETIVTAVSVIISIGFLMGSLAAIASFVSAALGSLM